MTRHKNSIKIEGNKVELQMSFSLWIKIDSRENQDKLIDWKNKVNKFAKEELRKLK